MYYASGFSVFWQEFVRIQLVVDFVVSDYRTFVNR